MAGGCIGERPRREHGTRNQRGEQKVQSAAAIVLRRGVVEGDSAFTPGLPVWTAPAAAELERAFVDNPDLGPGSFLEKLRGQLAGCSPTALQLAAELQYLSVLPLSDLKVETKRERIRRPLSSMAEPVAMPPELDSALSGGVFNGGMGYKVQVWNQFGVFISFVRAWTELPAAERQRLTCDPWAFRDLLQSTPGSKPAGQRHALAYLAFPDVFEPIISDQHKRKIRSAFADVVAPTGDLDRDLLTLREHFEQATGEPFDWYQPPYRDKWLAPPQGQSATAAAPSRRAWLVRGASVQGTSLVSSWLAEGWISLAATHLPPVEGGTGHEELKHLVDENYGHVSYSQRDQKLDEFHAFLTRMQPGDIVATTDKGALYVGEVDGDVEYRSAEALSRLRRPVRWDNPGEGVDFADLPATLVAKLQSPHELLDLTAQLPELEELVDRNEAVAPVAMFALPDVTDDLADELLMPRAWLQECVELLRDRPQLVLYGPPGTGKTYLAQKLARYLAGPEGATLVQFHPAYSYEDFFEGYRPVAGEGGTVAFKLRPGPLRRVVDQALQHPEQPFVLIIDELNRGNLARIFGELYFLLEYRDEAIELLYASGDDKAFTLPPNVLVIGTMNTADRSIALVDAAMRRRFNFVSLHPDEEPTRDLLGRWLEREGRQDEPAQLLAELNRRIDDSDFKVGPSYLMRPAAHQGDGLERVWRTAILPLLEEHHYGEAVNVRRRYGLPALRASLASGNDTLDTESAAPAEPNDAVAP